MRRDQLEHLIRAAGDVLGEDRVIIGGSQAILAMRHEADLPVEATLSNEADVLPVDDVDERKADLIDGMLGEGSLFHQTHLVYADGIGEATMVLPAGWQGRLVALSTANTGGVTGLCVEPHDAAVAKLVAGRDKDLRYVRALLTSGILDKRTLALRLRRTRTTPARKRAINAWLSKAAPVARPPTA